MQQLRIFKINPDHYEEFLRLWMAGVYTSRLAQGWQIEAWSNPEQNEFVWILARDCTPEEWEAHEKAYYESPERQALDPDPAQYIEDGEHRWLQPLKPQ